MSTRTSKSPPLCERTDVTPDNKAVYRVESRSRPGEFWHPVIDLEHLNTDKFDGLQCDCEHFAMTLRPKARARGERIDIGTSRYHCYHIERAIKDCIEVGDIHLEFNKD